MNVVGIMSSGVHISVHYFNVPRLGDVNNPPDPDEELLVQSIDYLLLNQQDIDDAVDVKNGVVDGQANNIIDEANENVQVGHNDREDVNVNNIDIEDGVNNNNNVAIANEQVGANNGNVVQGNAIDEEAVDEHFVDVSQDPVVWLNLNGETFNSVFCLCFYSK